MSFNFRYLVFSVYCLSTIAGFSQADFVKPVIDTSVYGKWPQLDECGISNDGRYCYYSIDNFRFSKQNCLVIKSLDSKWQIEIRNADASSVKITEDSKYLLCISGSDTLTVVALGNDKMKYFPNTTSFFTHQSSLGDIVVYSTKEVPANLTLYNLEKKSLHDLGTISNFIFNANGEEIAYQKEDTSTDGNILSTVKIYDILSGRSIPIWKSSEQTNLMFDKRGKQLVFLSNSNSNIDNREKKSWSICYYNSEMTSAEPITSDTIISQSEKFNIPSDNLMKFSENGEKLYFLVNKNKRKKAFKNPDFPTLDVWNFRDKYLQTSQLEDTLMERAHLSGYTGVVNLVNRNVLVLDNANFEIQLGRSNDKYLCGFSEQYPDYFYNKSSRSSIYLTNSELWETKLIGRSISYGDFQISPGEKFIIWYDTDSMNYYCYDVLNKKLNNISKNLSEQFYDRDAFKVGRRQNFGIAGWYPKDHSVLIYGQYDIWEVDPIGMAPPKNLTNNYGQKMDIAFGILETEDNVIVPNFNKKNTLVVSVFDGSNKNAGFYEIDLKEAKDPRPLTMDAASYYVPVSNNYSPRVGRTGNVLFASSGKPIKAKYSYRWLITKMDAAHSPNLFITTDFRKFSRVSDIHPETEFNWLSAELLKWKIDENRYSQGILYKPDNFDTLKKYPIIFTYYEKRTDELFQYLKPEMTEDRIDIPTYVSNGYLVFVPDFYFTQGQNGESILKVMTTAVKFLSGFSYVDVNRMGLQGHSFAGWATNYLVTHSTLFAAACETSGSSDLISGYDQLLANRESRQELYEVGLQGSPFGVGNTPWSAPEQYIENSPIFFVDKVKTPLLMVHGDVDTSVPFEQAMEMFLAMKRAGKTVWLLQYNKEGHSIEGKNALDYTIRMKQFFDHYLKNAPSPKWMTEGIPAKLKGIEDGLKLDTSSNLP